MTNKQHDIIRNFTRTLTRFNVVFLFDKKLKYHLSHEPGAAVKLYTDLANYHEKKFSFIPTTVMAFARTLRKFKIVDDRYWFYKDLMAYWFINMIKK